MFDESIDKVHSSNNAIYAMKVFYPDKSTKKSILLETLITSLLCNGDNIIQLYYILEKNSTYILIEEYVKNTNYHQLYPVFTSRDIIYYAYELLKGLVYAHNMNVIHRDIRPDNIMIDHDHKILRIIDWGSATIYTEGYLFMDKYLIYK